MIPLLSSASGTPLPDPDGLPTEAQLLVSLQRRLDQIPAHLQQLPQCQGTAARVNDLLRELALTDLRALQEARGGSLNVTPQEIYQFAVDANVVVSPPQHARNVGLLTRRNFAYMIGISPQEDSAEI